ncbi:hypothetical protein U0070_027629 [Myodes glareolus]|uniref:Uncharacterized protein n=1 Tax=Myodes glareolus TaxID=447135 RepID=A0AAW0HS33_MYOGA
MAIPEAPNILLDAEDNVKLLYFGLATRCKAGTVLQGHCGTKTFTAPELVMKCEENIPSDTYPYPNILDILSDLGFDANAILESLQKRKCNEVVRAYLIKEQVHRGLERGCTTAVKPAVSGPTPPPSPAHPSVSGLHLKQRACEPIFGLFHTQPSQPHLPDVLRPSGQKATTKLQLPPVPVAAILEEETPLPPGPDSDMETASPPQNIGCFKKLCKRIRAYLSRLCCFLWAPKTQTQPMFTNKKHSSPPGAGTLQSLDGVATRDLLACALDRNRVDCGVFLRSRSLGFLAPACALGRVYASEGISRQWRVCRISLFLHDVHDTGTWRGHSAITEYSPVEKTADALWNYTYDPCRGRVSLLVLGVPKFLIYSVLMYPTPASLPQVHVPHTCFPATGSRTPHLFPCHGLTTSTFDASMGTAPASSTAKGSEPNDHRQPPGHRVAAEGKQTLCSKGTLFHMDRRNTFRHSARQGSDPQVNSPRMFKAAAYGHPMLLAS